MPFDSPAPKELRLFSLGPVEESRLLSIGMYGKLIVYKLHQNEILGSNILQIYYKLGRVKVF